MKKKSLPVGDIFRGIVNALMLCLFLFTGSNGSAQSYKWQNVPIGAGGFVSGLFPSKKEKGLLYARTDVGGAYRWDAKTTTWIPLLDWVSTAEMGFLGVESLVTDPKNPNRLYLLAGMSYFNEGRTAILKSEDYGATFKIIETTPQFKAHGNGMGRGTGEKLTIDPLNPDILYCGTRWDGLFKSTNAGETWKKVNGFPINKTPNENGISFVILDPSNNAGGKTQTIYVGVSMYGKNIYKSTDGGNTFAPVEGLPAEVMPQRGLLVEDGNLFITYGNGAGPHGHWAVPEPMDKGEVWRFNTKTNKAKNITPPGFTRPFGGISVDPKDPKRLVLSTMNTWMLQHHNAFGDRVLLTKDGGDTWKDLFANGKMKTDPNGITWVEDKAIHWTGSIEFDPFNTKTVWITSGNGVFRTLDIDAEEQVWQFDVKGFEEVVPIELASIKNGPVISVILDYDGFVHTDVFQYAPIHKPHIGSTTGIDYATLNPNIMLRAGAKMYYTLDGGKLWTEITTKKGEKGKVAVSADGKMFLYFPEKGNEGYWSDDLGQTWKTIKGTQMQNGKAIADPVNPNKFYLYNPAGVIMVSTDAGKTFTPAGENCSFCSGGSNIMRAVPEKEGDLWIPLYKGGLARSKDGGVTLEKIKNITECEAVGFGKEPPGSKFPTIFIWGTVNGVEGVHRSTDEGKTWIRVNDDAHEYGGPANGHFVQGDMNVFGRVYMSTAGRGVVMGNEVK